ncbi:hypothetical protein IV203_036743 [Nitzschia inconspicua]|uniref:Uncharacterized protein n=1 Tax=Nitzschia inconspicua TaxID=303405 RepID=A0A9K3LGE9_9STRA|nr:hypothetical protein IV203_036743 [Nitzschia inconspicua]
MTAKKKSTKKRAVPATVREGTPTSTTPDIHDNQQPRKLTFWGKVTVFLVFPFCVGLFGLFSAFLEQRSESGRKMRIERDFALPFTMSLLLIVVVGFQTSQFTSNPKPLVKWPKIRKERKVRHVHVVKGQDPNAAVAAENERGEVAKSVEKKND